MNKQEVIESLEKKRERALENIEYFANHSDNQEVMNRVRVDVYTTAIQAILEMDEPQAEKVEVPDFIAKLICKYKAKKETLVCSISNLYRESDEYKWYVDNAEIYERAWVDGYTVKPKRWVVKFVMIDAVKYFSKFNGCNDLDYNYVGRKENAHIFTDKSKAEAVAVLVDGSVDEV